MKALLKPLDQSPQYRNDQNIEIYKDTLLKATQYPIAVTKKYTFGSVQYHLKHQLIMDTANCEIVVINSDSVTQMMVESENHVAILNMASRKRPGGGVAKGSRAQEESLFRCSNLGLSISNEHYPLKDDELLYTTGATFFKDFYYNDTPDAYVCDVITCAAINLNGLDEVPSNYEELTRNKVAAIFDVALYNGADTLILGAWGCGVFKNDPAFIAQLFKEAAIARKKNFLKVIFAIINDHNSVANNYSIFEKTFA